MLTGFLTFGILVGLTIALWFLTMGSGPLVAFLAYSFGGSIGLMTMAVAYGIRHEP
jgi:hypothetical protein